MDDIVIRKENSQLDLSGYLSKEWLETNGLGGYASSTILNCHTRKYHGLLTVQLDQPPGKFLLLSQVEDEVIFKNQHYPLSVFEYLNITYAPGFQYFDAFRQHVCPELTYHCGGNLLAKQIMLAQEKNAVLLYYRFMKAASFQLRIRPLLAMRGYHDLTHANAYLRAHVVPCFQGIAISPYAGMPTLFLQVNAPFQFFPEPCWYYQFKYRQELIRGYAGDEDLFSPGIFVIESGLHLPVIFTASLQELNDGLALWQQEYHQRLHRVKQLRGNTPLQRRLQFSARSFLFKNTSDQLSVVAGYPWFGEWGRDAMISLPGLTLLNRKFSECLQVLQHFARHQQAGLIPNIVGYDHQTHCYDAADASLWFTWATQQYFYASKDLNAVRHHLWPTLRAIFESYSQGTFYNIHLTKQHLIWAGSENIKISWMDAVIDGVPMTPRYGYQVEINALWCNFLSWLYELATYLHDPLAKHLQSKLLLTQLAFQEMFYYQQGGYLYDFVNDKERNTDIRPNQIFAISLPYTALTEQQGLSVLKTVQKYLYTPYGLRTLAPHHPHYQGRYGGHQVQRDAAYHQGTVWPWLLGHFASALLRFYNKLEVKRLLAVSESALFQHLQQHGVGMIAELFDGDEPQEPHGCINQAWSVAEILRMIHLLTTRSDMDEEH